MSHTINCSFICSAYITSEKKIDPKSQLKNTSHVEYQKVRHSWVCCCNRNNYKLHSPNSELREWPGAHSVVY